MKARTKSDRKPAIKKGYTVFFFCFLFIMLLAPAFANEEPAMIVKLNETIEEVNSLDNSAFAGENRKAALVLKLDAVLKMIAADEYQESIDKLNYDILDKMDGCALYGMPDKTDWLITCPAQNDIYSRIQKAINLIDLWYGSYTAVFEEYPGWMTPDLAVTALTADPERSDPGDAVVFRAVVANVKKGESSVSAVKFYVDETLTERVPFRSLGPGGEVEVTGEWTAIGPGRHRITAEIEIGDGTIDKDPLNNSLMTSAWVSGEAVPEPELEFSDIDFEALQLTEGEPAVIPLKVRNPSFAEISDVPVFFMIDGVLVGDPDDICIPDPDAICPPILFGDMINLAPGEEQEFQISWSEVTAGQHTVQAVMELPDIFPDKELKYVKAWTFVVPYIKAIVCSVPGKGIWTSIGPVTLTDIPTNIYPHTNFAKDGNVGMILDIAFHPTNQNIMYAASPTGGLWKTTNGGMDWFPLGDGLPTLNIFTVAVDPERPDVVYQSTDKGIYKSIDGGTKWDHFADKSITGNVREIIIRNPTAGDVLIYTGSDLGVLRYKSITPLAKTSTASEWVNIKSGIVVDLETGGRHSTVYASFVKKEWSPANERYYNVFDGLHRTLSGSTTSGSSADWESVSAGLPALSSTGDAKDKPGALLFDMWWGNSQYMYAMLDNPPKQQGKLAIYFSDTWGTSWKLKEYVTKDGYNAFVRIAPYNKDLFYFGGIHLYMRNFADASGSPIVVGDNKVHDDMKSLRFDPFNLNYYYITSDGSIWRCMMGSAQDCSPRSYDLRTTQFYDIDFSPTDSNLIIGGTQDNGTILYQGSNDWKSIKGGDGNFSLFARGNVLYAQHQRLRDTLRCDKGTACGWTDWTLANGVNDTCEQQNNCNKLPDEDAWAWGKGYITYHPNDPSGNYLLAQGKQVYMTTDGGKNWYPKGPSGSNVKQDSIVTRVVVQPTTFNWIAGTSKGQLWYTSNPNAGWTLLDEHPFGGGVVNMAFAPSDYKILYVIYSAGGNQAYTRIYRYEMNPGPPVTWSAYPVTNNFPLDLIPRTIAGDGYAPDIAYAGTHKGGVYRLDFSKPTYESWQPYNTCLPGTVDVRELLVAPNKVLHAATWGRGAWRVTTGP